MKEQIKLSSPAVVATRDASVLGHRGLPQRQITWCAPSGPTPSTFTQEKADLKKHQGKVKGLARKDISPCHACLIRKKKVRK